MGNILHEGFYSRVLFNSSNSPINLNTQFMNQCSEKIHNLEPTGIHCNLQSKDKHGLPCLFLETLEFGVGLKSVR